MAQRTATLTNSITRQAIRVHATTDHPDSCYGHPVWVDDDNNAYMETDCRVANPFYDIVED